jgi:NAD(P)-dependent dehydrogenase (short-subunit alcohol dehydrogenase family)
MMSLNPSLPNFSLEGKKILVTGAAKRIGRAIAIRLHQEGALVGLHYGQSREEAEKLSQQLDNAPLFSADLSQVDQIQNLFRQVAETWGSLDGLVNNAARFTRIPMMEITEADWDQIHAVNLKAPFFCAQAAAKLMNNGGKIVNLASLGALRPWADFVHYCSAKAGLLMMTQAAAKALAPAIQVNAVAPGLIPFELDNPRTRAMIANTPMQRSGEPEEVADAVIYFLKAPTFVTGQWLAVDGGLSLR